MRLTVIMAYGKIERICFAFGCYLKKDSLESSHSVFVDGIALNFMYFLPGQVHHHARFVEHLSAEVFEIFSLFLG